MRTEPFEFQGEHGSRLVGKLDLPDGPAHAYALFAHCFTCTKESLAAVRIGRALAGQGIGVLRFDFTGLGQTEATSPTAPSAAASRTRRRARDGQRRQGPARHRPQPRRGGGIGCGRRCRT
jgi:putative redox protein